MSILAEKNGTGIQNEKTGAAEKVLFGTYFLCVTLLFVYIWVAGSRQPIAMGWIAYWSLACATLAFAPKYPLIGVCVYTALAYGISSHGPELDISLSLRILDAASMLALFGWIVARRNSIKNASFWRPATFFYGLLFGWIFIALTVALAEGVPWGPFLRHDPSGFAHAAAMFFICSDVIKRKRDSMVLALFLVITVCGRALLQGLGGIYLESYIATLLVMLFPVAMMGLLISENILMRISFGFFSLAMFTLLIYTQNRAAAVATFALLATLGWQMRGDWKKLLIWATLVTTIILALVPLGYADRFRALWDSTSTHSTAQLDRATAAGRIDLWEAGWEMAKDEPFFGVGPGNYPYFQAFYRPGMEPLAAHSSYIQMLAETGFPGLTLYLLLFLGTVLMLEHCINRAHDSWQRSIAKMLQLSLVAYLVGGIFNSRHDFVLAYILAGWAIAITKAHPKPTKTYIKKHTPLEPSGFS